MTSESNIIPVIGTDFQLILKCDPSLTSPFLLDYDIQNDGSVTYGAGKRHFTDLDFLTHDYIDPALFAALIVDVENKHLYIGVCDSNNPYPEFETRFPAEIPGFKPEIRIPISRFVTKKRILETM
jgi:hypothetical protein